MSLTKRHAEKMGWFDAIGYHEYNEKYSEYMRQKNKETMTFTFNTDDGGVNLDIEFTYYKGEEPVNNYGDGSGYPGSPSEIEIDKVEWVKGNDSVDITELYEYLCSNSMINQIKENALDYAEDR